MIRQTIVTALVLALFGGMQGSLMYAAAATVETPGVEASAAGASFSQALPEAFDGASACLRGARPCFGYGSNDCCAEMALLAAIAGTTGA